MAMKSVSKNQTSPGRPKEKIHGIISKRAYEISQKRGCLPGNEWVDWFEAEKQIKCERQSEISHKKS